METRNHGRLMSWEFSYSFGRFYYVDGKDCADLDTVEPRKKHPNNNYLVEEIVSKARNVVRKLGNWREYIVGIFWYYRVLPSRLL